MKRLPPIASISTILVTVTLPMRHFMQRLLPRGKQLIGARAVPPVDRIGPQV
jgi:hypothetical protein